MRLFIAVNIDPAARQAIGAAQGRIAAELRRSSALRWVHPDQMHLTLVFFGDVAESALPVIVAAIERPIDQPAFTIGFAGFGTFPLRGAPRVLWLGIESGRSELVRLQAEVAARMPVTSPGGDGRFSPHLTLARWRRASSAGGSDRANALAVAGNAEIARTKVDRITLYESHLSSAAPVYTERAHATLLT